MSNIFYDIQNYILFLRSKNFYISFSSFEKDFLPFIEELLQHQIHLHSICSYLKSNPKTSGMCTLSKKKLNDCKINHSVYLSCYAGVEEYIFPIFFEGKRIICIHVSGYRNNLKRSKRLMEKTRLLCEGIFDELYLQLSTDMPQKSVVESFIKPLEYMIISLYKEGQKITVSQSYDIFIRTLLYINENYMNNICADTISQKLGYSASYLRAVFKKSCGTSLQNKINDIRLQNAEFLLKNTNLSVTDIATQCGFCDPNYFSVIFKKKYSLSPIQYKKQ